MSEVTDFWAQNRASAIKVAERGAAPYARNLAEAFDFFEQRARMIQTSEGSFYDVLHDAMKGNLKPETNETVAYAVHLPAPYQPEAIDYLANNPVIKPTVRAILASDPSNVERRMRSVLATLCGEYHEHCSRLLQLAGAKMVVLIDPEQTISELAVGFDVQRFVHVPTADRFVPSSRSLACGFPDPTHLPAIRDAFGGINPYRKSVAFGSFLGECLNFPSRFETGNAFGISMLPFDRQSTQSERNVGATHYNVIQEQLVPDLRLHHEDPERNAGVMPVRTRVIAGMDLIGKYESAVSGATGYRNQAILDTPDCAIFPAKTLDEVKKKVLSLLGS